MVVGIFLMTTNLNVLGFPAMAIFVPHSLLPVFSDNCCVECHDALVVWRLSFPLVAAVLIVDPILFPSFAPSPLGTHFGVWPASIGELFK